MPRSRTIIAYLYLSDLKHIGDFEVVFRDGILYLVGPICTKTFKRPITVYHHYPGGLEQACMCLASLCPTPSYADELRKLVKSRRPRRKSE